MIYLSSNYSWSVIPHLNFLNTIFFYEKKKISYTKFFCYLGIASLFIAAKIEEIYPPKLSEFAYVTDGACSEAEIMMKELVIMKSLNWELSPATSNCWLGIYMQLVNALEEREVAESKENKVGLEMKHFSSHTFVQAARLLDLCTMDILSLRYSYSIIAAAAIYHTVSEKMALKSSGKLTFQLQFFFLLFFCKIKKYI